ncbi:MAG: Zn-ribbon domain-containing OB-fold protein [Thermoplasmata archaeon]|nr:MAG: Zn-ribbon domain-containing OB-fold protein [Thermoplasmata archaeon]
MGFDEFGVISFVPFSKVSEFPTYLKDGILKGMKCPKCDVFFFPPRSDCPECLCEDMEWFETKGEGTLITYTTIHAAPTGFEEKTPYTIGLMELDEGGRVLAWLEGMEESEIQIGMKLKTVPKKLDDDRITYQLEKNE